MKLNRFQQFYGNSRKQSLRKFCRVVATPVRVWLWKLNINVIITENNGHGGNVFP
jgi:hypothetical protein